MKENRNAISICFFLYQSGIHMVVNASQPVGSRVTAAVRCTDCDVPRYQPLDLNKTYKVLTQNYIGDGGGGYTVRYFKFKQVGRCKSLRGCFKLPEIKLGLSAVHFQ